MGPTSIICILAKPPLPSRKPWCCATAASSPKSGACRRWPRLTEKWFLGRLRTLDPLLEAQEYLCAGRFTAADISVGYALMLAGHTGLDADFSPAVAAYWQRLSARPAFERALRAQAETAEAQGVSTTPAPDLIISSPQTGAQR
jgi:glutathione S-transferase